MTTTEPRSRTLSTLAHAGRGALMGAFDIVPGVSGGTLALILGIYARLITSIRAAAGLPLALLRGPAEVRGRASTVEWRFVLPLAAGMAVAIVIGALTIEPLLDAYPQRMRGLFAGLIVASLVVPFRAVTGWTPWRVTLVAAGAVAAFLLTGIPPAEIVDPSLIVVFAAASVAICAMILPGVSGAFLLQAMGLYAPTLGAISDRDLAYVAVFALGAVIGLGLFAKLLEHLLTTRGDAMMALLLGLMTGALRALWPWQGEDRQLLAPGGGEGLVGLLFVAGFVFVTILLILGRRAERRRA